jgi:protein-disulfide isomerase
MKACLVAVAAGVFAFLACLPVSAQDPTAATADLLVRVAPDLGWVQGQSEAPVTVVEFSDPSCPYCADFHGQVRSALHDEFVDTGRVRWITLSYVSGLYRNSLLAVQAAECAGEQGDYESYMDAVYDGRDGWLKADRTAALDALREMAAHLELDVAAWDRCRNERRIRERVRQVNALAEEVGVRGTPTWFVDGFPVMGALPLGYARSFIADRLEGGG